MIPIDLNGKIAVVTGGTGELGRTMVRTLVRAGADVAIGYHRNAEKAKELVAESIKMGRSAIAIKTDVTNEENILAFRDEVEKKLGVAQIIVNNAVSQYKWTSILGQSSKDYVSQFESCVLHNVFMAKAFVPGMKKLGWGRVIGINTECAMQNFPTQSAYVSGKRGQDGVLRILAREVGEFGITVNQVAPGWTISENSRSDGSDKSYIKSVPLGRRGTDQEIANVVVFLASDLAEFISGAYIPVCGGNVMPSI